MTLKLITCLLFSVLFFGCQNTPKKQEQDGDIERLEYLVFHKSDSLNEHLNGYKMSIDQLAAKYKQEANPLTKAKLNYFTAHYFYANEEDRLADSYFKKCVPILSRFESRSYLMLIDGTTCQGQYEFNSGNYNTAKQYYKQAVYYSEKYFDRDTLTPKFATAAFEGFGCANRVLNQFPLAIEYLEKTIQLAQKQQDSARLVSAHANLSLVYTDIKKLNLALVHIKKAESIAMISHHDDLPMVYNYYASVYFEMKDWNQVLFYLNKEFEADPKTTEVDKSVNLSIVYLELQKPNLAKPYVEFLENEYLSNRLDPYNNVQVLERLVKYYTQVKDFQKVSHYFEQYGKAQQAFYTNDQLATTEDFTKKYDLKAKEDHINLLNQKNQLVENQLSQKNIVILIIVLALLLIVAIGLSLYFQQRNKKLNVEKQLLITKDTLLRSQMEPHFVFNALSSLQSLIYENQNQLAVKYLSKFARLLRLSLEHSRMKFVPFVDEIESIENYLELQQMRFSNTFDYTISGNRSDLENDAIPPMMIQPFVENAIYHGFANLDYQGALKIAFEKHADFVSFTITDNGSGIEASKNNTDKTKTSLSTTITIERLKSLVTTKNKIDFLEITNNPNEKSGTVVVLRMPYIQTL